MTFGFGIESLEHANCTRENPSHSAIYMVYNMGCSLCLLKTDVYKNWNFRDGRMTFIPNMQTP